MRPPSRQEGVIKGETRCFPLEIASRLCRGKRASAQARAILRVAPAQRVMRRNAQTTSAPQGAPTPARRSPPSRQEGVIKGETRCFPLEIAPPRWLPLEGSCRRAAGDEAERPKQPLHRRARRPRRAAPLRPGRIGVPASSVLRPKQDRRSHLLRPPVQSRRGSSRGKHAVSPLKSPRGYAAVNAPPPRRGRFRRGDSRIARVPSWLPLKGKVSDALRPARAQKPGGRIFCRRV
jgi:hypothetical protein